MTERLHTPPAPDFIHEHTPLVFLGGPIQGAPDWQGIMTAALLTNNSELEVASPRRVSLDHAFNYDQQIAWEKEYMFRSHRFGAIVFWFAAQDFSLPYEEGRPYAKTSRSEIGRTFGWHDYKPYPIIVGIEPGFEIQEKQEKVERYIRSFPAEKDLPVYTTLDDVIEQTLKAVPPTKC